MHGSGADHGGFKQGIIDFTGGSLGLYRFFRECSLYLDFMMTFAVVLLKRMKTGKI